MPSCLFQIFHLGSLVTCFMQCCCGYDIVCTVANFQTVLLTCALIIVLCKLLPFLLSSSLILSSPLPPSLPPQNADSISAAIIGSYITGTDEDISHCFDLVQSSLRCSSDTSGSFTATLVSFASNPPRFDRDSALEAASDLPFTISQAYHATPPPTTVLVPTTTISTSDEVPEEETLHTLVGVAVGVPLLLLLVVTGLAVVYWRKQKRKPAEANAK